MAEEPTEAGVARSPEGDEVKFGDPGWLIFRVEAGEILEFILDPLEAGGESVRCALLVNEVRREQWPSFLCGGVLWAPLRLRRTESSAKSINVRGQGVHKCVTVPCGEKGHATHFLVARWWTVGNFPRTYLKEWGHMVLDEALGLMGPGEEEKTAQRRSQKETTSRKSRGGRQARRSTSVAKKVQRRMEEIRKTEGREEDWRDPQGEKQQMDVVVELEETLAEQLFEKSWGTSRIVLIGERQEGKATPRMVLGTGSNLNPKESRLAIADWALPEGTKGNSSKNALRVKKERVKRRRKSEDEMKRRRRSSLLAMAEHREEQNRKRRTTSRRSKQKKRGPVAKELVKLLSGKRKRVKDGDGGSSPSSSGSTEDGDSEAEASSSESEVTAPLKRRSQKKSRIDPEAAHRSCDRSFGSVSDTRDGQGVGGDRRHKDGDPTSTFLWGRTSIRGVAIWRRCICWRYAWTSWGVVSWSHWQTPSVQGFLPSTALRWKARGQQQSTWNSTLWKQFNPPQQRSSWVPGNMLGWYRKAKEVETDNGGPKATGPGTLGEEEIGTKKGRAKEKEETERVERKEKAEETIGGRTIGTNWNDKNRDWWKDQKDQKRWQRWEAREGKGEGSEESLSKETQEKIEDEYKRGEEAPFVAKWLSGLPEDCRTWEEPERGWLHSLPGWCWQRNQRLRRDGFREEYGQFSVGWVLAHRPCIGSQRRESFHLGWVAWCLWWRSFVRETSLRSVSPVLWSSGQRRLGYSTAYRLWIICMAAERWVDVAGEWWIKKQWIAFVGRSRGL